MDKTLQQFSQIPPSERVLLLPHCLRRSKTCKATYDVEGLQCAKCDASCSVNRLKEAALKNGYKGLCVAPGGKLAIKYVKTKQPNAVLAVACDKELMEGVQAIKGLDSKTSPTIVIIPLIKDGCIDTTVDQEEALKIINIGCAVPVAGINRN